VAVFSASLKKAWLGFVFAAASLTGASPVMANSSASAADIAAPLRAAQAARQTALGHGDEEFRRLFSLWQSKDNASALIASTLPASPFGVARGKVSIPSLMPVAVAGMSSGFGMRVHPVLGGRRAHKGIDLAAPAGTPIHASADGEVSKAEWFSSYGLYVSLEHGGDIQTRYGHMSRLNVMAGQKVRKGDVIGYVGSTGRSTGPHLHYEVRIAGLAVNPVPYLQAEPSRAEGAMGGP